jgi:hypothetical protein
MVGPVIERSRTARGCAGIYSPEQCRSFAFEVESGDSLRFIIRRDPSTDRFLLALITRSAVSTTAITVLLCGGGERAGLASDYRSVGQGRREEAGVPPLGQLGTKKITGARDCGSSGISTSYPLAIPFPLPDRKARIDRL